MRSALPPPKSRRNISLNSAADGGEAFGEALARILVDFADQFFELALGVGDVGELAGERRLAFLELRLLDDGIEIHVAQAGDFALEIVDFRGDGIPVHRLRPDSGVGLVQVDLQFFHACAR